MTVLTAGQRARSTKAMSAVLADEFSSLFTGALLRQEPTPECHAQD